MPRAAQRCRASFTQSPLSKRKVNSGEEHRLRLREQQRLPRAPLHWRQEGDPEDSGAFHLSWAHGHPQQEGSQGTLVSPPVGLSGRIGGFIQRQGQANIHRFLWPDPLSPLSPSSHSIQHQNSTHPLGLTLSLPPPPRSLHVLLGISPPPF